jgi:hypothetical protein
LGYNRIQNQVVLAKELRYLVSSTSVEWVTPFNAAPMSARAAPETSY